MSRIASHGFVAIAAVSMVGDDDDVLSANLDWLLAENARPGSMLFGKLDATKVAAGGHSIGAVNAFLFADDPRLTTTLHVEKLEADYAAATAPVFLTRITGADHVSATRDGLPMIVAWLRWQLGGETERGAMFLDAAGEFRNAPYVSESKNW